ncbi:hypothetical protein T492DRAFT_1097674 [Pavlovales sp. CCMP2436]|nr:hypothetical protein T492DRAFT_1097674 [Pavlovales sp. CCMP2436]
MALGLGGEEAEGVRRARAERSAAEQVKDLASSALSALVQLANDSPSAENVRHALRRLETDLAVTKRQAEEAGRGKAEAEGEAARARAQLQAWTEEAARSAERAAGGGGGGGGGGMLSAASLFGSSASGVNAAGAELARRVADLEQRLAKASEERKVDTGAWEYARALVLRYADDPAERAQLVPALGMCLKLSEEEKGRLASAAAAEGGAASSLLRRFF